MNTAVAKRLKGQSWRDAYQAAVCESDLNKLPGCIDDAEAAILERTGELVHAVGDGAEERESLDDTICILLALRGSLKHRPAAVERGTDLGHQKTA
jgi:hypothetical protein